MQFRRHGDHDDARARQGILFAVPLRFAVRPPSCPRTQHRWHAWYKGDSATQQGGGGGGGGGKGGISIVFVDQPGVPALLARNWRMRGRIGRLTCTCRGRAACLRGMSPQTCRRWQMHTSPVPPSCWRATPPRTPRRGKTSGVLSPASCRWTTPPHNCADRSCVGGMRATRREGQGGEGEKREVGEGETKIAKTVLGLTVIRLDRSSSLFPGAFPHCSQFPHSGVRLGTRGLAWTCRLFLLQRRTLALLKNPRSSGSFKF